MRIRSLIILSISLATFSCGIPNGVANSALKKLSDLEEAEITKAIEKSDDLKSLAGICDELGDVEGFTLIGRHMSTHPPLALYYYFNSNQTLSDSTIILHRFAEVNSWTPVQTSSPRPNNTYEKGNYLITLQHGGMGKAEYGFTCSVISREVK